jgi:hypothetical protein
MSLGLISLLLFVIAQTNVDYWEIFGDDFEPVLNFFPQTVQFDLLTPG